MLTLHNDYAIFQSSKRTHRDLHTLSFDTVKDRPPSIEGLTVMCEERMADTDARRDAT